MFLVFITKNERNEYSYISFSGFCFFSGKSLKLCTRSFFFDFLRFDFFQVQFISFVKRKTKFTIEQKKGKGHEKRDRFRSGF